MSSSSSSSFSSPASVLKLHDALHGSSHSAASFSVNDKTKAVLRTTPDGRKEHPISLPPFLDDNDKNDAEDKDRQRHGYSSSSSNSIRNDTDIVVNTTAQLKSVSFSSHVETHDILHNKSMDDKEKNDRWYQKKEWKSLRRDGRVTRRLMENSELANNHETLGFCTLGLKKETHPYAREKQLHKMLYHDLLMSEQQRQRDEGIKDADVLAHKLIQLQCRCRHAAFVSSLRPSHLS